MTAGPVGRAVRPVGVRFGRNDPLRFFDAGELELAVHDQVVAPGPDGPQVGRVVVAPDQVFDHPFAELPRLLGLKPA